MAPKKVLIKKYENRRLYDATNSRYVNLDDVAGMVQRGDDVRAIDVATGDDITRLILTQIIVEGAKTHDSGFPLDILRDMIVASGRASQESALRYTRAMLDLYKSTYRAISPALNPFEFMQHASGAAVQEASPQAAGTETEQESGGSRSEVVNLKERVAELEKMVSSLGPKRKQSPKPARKSPRQRKRK
jgi:polyhydroxyalkanoate synthesis repressor PhaR